MKTVFMTGAGGGMGFESFRQMLPDIGKKYNVTLLLRDSEKKRNLFASYNVAHGKSSSVQILCGNSFLHVLGFLFNCAKNIFTLSTVRSVM